MGRAPTLSQMVEIHRKGGLPPGLIPSMRGEIELKLRDAESGRVQMHLKKKNLATGVWPLMWGCFWDVAGNSSLWVGISDDPNEMHPRKSVVRSSLEWDSVSGYPAISVAPTINTSTATYTFQVVFQQPTTASRFVNMIYVAKGTALKQTAYGCVHGNIVAGTKLTQTVEQTTGQTLEVTYRISFSRGV